MSQTHLAGKRFKAESASGNETSDSSEHSASAFILKTYRIIQVF